MGLGADVQLGALLVLVEGPVLGPGFAGDLAVADHGAFVDELVGRPGTVGIGIAQLTGG